MADNGSTGFHDRLNRGFCRDVRGLDQSEALRGKDRHIEGTIVAIGRDVAFVDVGGKGEATIEVEELKDADGDIEVAVGDRIQAMVVSTEGGHDAVTAAGAGRRDRQAARGRVPRRAAGRRQGRKGDQGRLRSAHRPRARLLPVLPDRHRPGTDPAMHVGQVYAFRIIEYKEGGRNLVSRGAPCSRRSSASSADEVRRSIVAGAVLTGRSPPSGSSAPSSISAAACRVCSTYRRWAGRGSSDPSQVVKARRGDHRQDPARRRGRPEDRARLEAAERRPVVDRAGATYEVGQVHSGRVTRVDRLRRVCRARARRRSAGARFDVSRRPAAATAGPQISPRARPPPSRSWHRTREEAHRRRARRRGFVARRGGGVAAPGIAPGARLTGKVERHEKFGVFVFLAPGRTGLIPMSETGVAREADVTTASSRSARDVEVIVLEVDPSGRRIRLSAKAVQAAREAAEVREYSERADPPGAGGLGLARRQAARRADAQAVAAARPCAKVFLASPLS